MNPILIFIMWSAIFGGLTRAMLTYEEPDND